MTHPARVSLTVDPAGLPFQSLPGRAGLLPATKYVLAWRACVHHNHASTCVLEQSYPICSCSTCSTAISTAPHRSDHEHPPSVQGLCCRASEKPAPGSWELRLAPNCGPQTAVSALSALLLVSMQVAYLISVLPSALPAAPSTPAPDALLLPMTLLSPLTSLHVQIYTPRSPSPSSPLRPTLSKFQSRPTRASRHRAHRRSSDKPI